MSAESPKRIARLAGQRRRLDAASLGGSISEEHVGFEAARRRPGDAPHRRRGFTLIELMVTIALVALVAAVAYPSYVSSVQKARRAEAKSALTEAAQRLERYHTENNTYVGALFCADGSAGCTAVRRIYDEYSENRHYRLDFNGSATVSAYLLVAVPQDNQVRDACGKFLLDQAGRRRTVDMAGTEIDFRKCW